MGLLLELGFTRVAEVRKTRRRFQFQWQDATVEGAWDEVRGLGEFLELELAVPESEIPAAEARILSLAEHLQLGPSERRGYLELLVTKGLT